MSTYDEVKYLRSLQKHAMTEIRIRNARIEGLQDRCENLEGLLKSQQEVIREANDARRVSQHYALKHLAEALRLQEVIDEAREQLDYDLSDKPITRDRCGQRIWSANQNAWLTLHLSRYTK